MLTLILNTLFGCSHRRTSFPQTPTNRNSVSADTSETRSRTYVTCLDCGKEFDYNWTEMKIGARARAVATSVIAPRTFTVHQSVR